MEEMCYITPPIPEEEEIMKFEFAPKKPSGKMSIAAAKKQDFTSLEDKTLRKRTVVSASLNVGLDHSWAVAYYMCVCVAHTYVQLDTSVGYVFTWPHTAFCAEFETSLM